MSFSCIADCGLSLLNDILASGSASTGASSGSSSSSTSATGNDESFSSCMTIAQIRDAVDKMATSGQLTSDQQMALISAGLQDLDATNPSYQPAGQTGYTRSTTGTYDPVSMLERYAAFDTSQGNTSMASMYSRLADLFESKTISTVNLSA